MPDINDWRRDQIPEPQNEQDEIRKRGFLIYVQRWIQPDRALDDWLTAEREVKAFLNWMPPQFGVA